MSEKRRAAYILNFQRGKTGKCKLEVFRKSQWTGKEADRYMYRLRLNNKWINGTHGDRQYVDREAVMNTVRSELGREDIL